MPTLPWEADASIPPQDLSTFYRIAGLYFYDDWPQVLCELDASWSRLSAHMPLMAELHRMKGKSLDQLCDLPGALRNYAEAIRWDPTLLPMRENLERLRQPALDRIAALYEADDYEELIELTAAYRAAYPKVRREYVDWVRGVALDLLGRANEAEPLLRDLTEHAPHRSEVWHSLAVVLTHLHRRVEAAEVCREGTRHLEAHGRDPEKLGEMLASLDDDDRSADAEEPDAGRPAARLH